MTEEITTTAPRDPHKIPTGPKVVKVFDKLSYLVVATPYSHRVEYSIYEIQWMDGERAFMTKKGSVCNTDASDIIADSEVFMEISVKWDGCSNWIIPEHRRGMMSHCCSKEDLINVGQIMAECWDMTEALCPHWSY